MQTMEAKTIDLRSGSPEDKRREIRDYFLKTWEIDDRLYTQLKSDEIFYHRGDPLRHIILFYLGHTAAFYINKLVLTKLVAQRVNPAMESIFAIGVDEMSWDDLNNNHYDWPTVAETRQFREEVKRVVLNVIDNAPLEMPITWESPLWIIMMGIEHQRIHIETSSVLIRQLPLDEVVARRFGERCTETGIAPQNELVEVEGKTMVMGKPMDHPYYGWDNEYGSYSEEVGDFKAAKYLTSNREFLDFIQDGGYATESYWTEEGWNWRSFKQAEMPLFWRKDGDTYRLRLVAEEIDMPWNWPVEVNDLEAKAFCNWKTKRSGKAYRLPTEAEWYLIHEMSELHDMMDWKETPADINLAHYTSPTPVDKYQHGPFFDVIGNVWQWTETPITGFNGFKVHPAYDDFSTPTFDGKHNLIKGGSWISTGNEATVHARYAFRRHFYQHAGFRYVQSDQPLVIQRNDYETDAEVALACEKDWGDAFGVTPNFAKDLGALVKELVGNHPDAKILDLNTDTGRLAFELATDYNHITALDFTARMLRMAIQLQDQGGMRYVMEDENDLVHYREVVLKDFGLGMGAKNITFMQADINNIKPIFTGYDVVIMPDILNKVAHPRAFLRAIADRMNPNAILIVATDYKWDVRETPHKYWLGGYKKDGEPVTGFDALTKVLLENFDSLRHPQDLTLVQPKTSRIKELRRLEVTVWRKK